MIQWVNPTKSWYIDKINKTNKPLVKLTKRRKEKTQVNKIRGEKENITTNANEIQKILWDYFKDLYSSKVKNEEEIDNFPDTYYCQNWTRGHSKLKQINNKQWDWDSYK
jgi:hypothetical protein